MLNPDLGEAMAIPMPPHMQDAISKAGLLPKDHPLHSFIMAIAELAVCPMGQLQWGHTWRSQYFPLVLFATDNQNACAWLGSMFANNELAQDLCRLITSLCFTEEHTVRSLWWPTYISTMADLISRMLDENGNEIASVREEFEGENAKLEKPYRIPQPEEIDPRVGELVSWMGGLNHAFSVLQGIPLRSDLCGPKGSTHSCKTNVTSSINEGEEMVHVHVQCTHGFVLISGMRDATLQPACGLTKCMKEGKSWLRSQGLIDPSAITAREGVVGGSERKLPVWIPCRHGAVLLHGGGDEQEHPDHTTCVRGACVKEAQRWWSTEGSKLTLEGGDTSGLLSSAQQQLAKDWKHYVEQRKLGPRF